MKIPEIVWVTHATVLEAELKEAVKCGIGGIRLRCKNLSNEALIDLGKAAREITRQAGKQLTIHATMSVAEEIQADGIHLPESMIECCYHNTSLPANVSVHSLEAGILAEQRGAAALTFGPIFPTPSKKIYGAPQGLERLEVLVRAVSIPVYAIGGITPVRIKMCLQSGACGVMMQSHISSMVGRRHACP